MKTQRVRFPDGKTSWVVLDDKYQPIQPITQYIRYLQNLERSPNTVSSYASHMKLYWEFLQDACLDWTHVNLEKLADFVLWLREPGPGTISIQSQEARRSERTINKILSAIYGFYEFHYRIGNVEDLKAYGYQFLKNRRYKPFLQHITKSRATRTCLLKLKEPKRKVQTFTQEQIKQLIDSCYTTRDKFLLCLLLESGIRIGQALGLRHEDIRSWDNEIDIVPRKNNANGARSKSLESNTIHVSQELMGLYSQYLITEYPEDLNSDYVFVNLWGGEIGKALTYNAVNQLFRRLSEKTGIPAHAHIFRHTHATDLIREGWDSALIQKRLGHANVQTTINTYTHLNDADMKAAYQEYWQKKQKERQKKDGQ
ncbi:MAG TPA: tyrosine-type recombinase/integrase [Leptolyngbyaceae cyanobacterium M33_DOE_097]|uniref:Transposase n=1 Tax=Oscillatoriales cyanobacterium SpSt-418 TaxID=2282169 RepID=A0A7C3KCX5_9CYAN|nr:tyrosine-type recombinase/integrase [Leptolyngbyaceae cyanobacterium M33_DOE_097]